jgi:hypothetical protein
MRKQISFKPFSIDFDDHQDEYLPKHTDVRVVRPDEEFAETGIEPHVAIRALTLKPPGAGEQSEVATFAD